jgi:hypothetical protein
VSYYVTDVLIGKDIKIMRDTRVGMRIDSMRSKGASVGDILKYVGNIMIKKMKPDDIVNHIESVRSNAFEEGRKSKTAEIRHILGIYDY